MSLTITVNVECEGTACGGSTCAAEGHLEEDPRLGFIIEKIVLPADWTEDLIAGYGYRSNKRYLCPKCKLLDER